MPYDPLEVIAEVLGEPADQMRNPANVEYRCPFIDSRCTKYSRTLEAPAPVCSVLRKRRPGTPQRPPIAVCPKRYFEADIPADVMRECWVGPAPANPRFIWEVGMEKFGRVDLVIADLNDEHSQVRTFLPVELQAVDITGSVLPYYLALTDNRMAEDRHDYGFNWANVRKRYLSQLIAKGFYAHQWGTRIVAVIQTDLFEQFQRHARAPEVAVRDSNIVFLLYQFRLSAEGRWQLSFERAAPTTHVNVMNAILYERPPSREAFERKLLERVADA